METAFDRLFRDLSRLSAAEEFLDHFGVAYEPAVVRVNRLHILKRFQQYLGAAPGITSLDEAELRATCRALLAQAYDDFVHSSPLKEKVFKVLQNLDTRRVGVETLRRTLPSLRNGV